MMPRGKVVINTHQRRESKGFMVNITPFSFLLLSQSFSLLLRFEVYPHHLLLLLQISDGYGVQFIDYHS